MLKKVLCAAALSVIATIAAAKGPIGLGKLEIGITKEAAEALTASDGAYLSTPMTPFINKYSSPKLGEDIFETQITSTLAEGPLKAVLTFKDGMLKSLHISFKEPYEAYDRTKELIASKYGTPTVHNSMKEEQCIYRNGANFKISSGSIRYVWTQERIDMPAINTTLSEAVVDVCPSSLQDALPAIKAKSLSIGVAAPPVTKPANPF